MTNEVTIMVPLALQNLIRSNNQLLKNYQDQLLQEVQEANTQMMQLMRLDAELGWKLDVDRMVYVRPKTEEDQPVEEEQQPTE